MSRCAYIFLDESGNFDFGPNGTRYFLLTSVGMRRPFRMLRALDDYRHDCLEEDRNVEYFHCSRDRGEVRRNLFNVIAGYMDEIQVHSLVVEKARINPRLQRDTRFYPEMLGQLLKVAVPYELKEGAEEVLVITDTIPVNRKRQAVEKAVQTTLIRTLPSSMKYRVLHHQSRSHYGLQVADYCCWAIFRKWQKGDMGYYGHIAPALRGEFKVAGSRAASWRNGE